MGDRQFEVYKITNRLNGKAYIGITMRDVLRRWKEHIRQASYRGPKLPLHEAIAEIGLVNFSIEHIACARSAYDLCVLEMILIQQDGTATHANGYNANFGAFASNTYLSLASKPAPPETTYFNERKPVGLFTHDEISDIFAHYDGGWKIVDIATEFETSANAVKRCIARAEQCLLTQSGGYI